MEKYCYEYPRPSVATDCIVFGFDEGDLKILLIERGGEPYIGKWALPGGFLQMDESTEECVKRELFEETSVKNLFLEQLYTFSDVDRDPRGRVISVAYYALVRIDKYKVKGGDDARRAEWFSVNSMPELAFDHSSIIEMAFDRLKSKIRYQPIGFELLPEKFTMQELLHLYEVVLQKTLDKRNFIRKFNKLGLLIALSEKVQNVPYRAPRYFKFDNKNYKQLLKKGLNFEI